MERTLKIKGINIVIIVVFLFGTIASGAIHNSQSVIRDNYEQKNVHPTEDVVITLSVDGMSHSQSISYESGLSLKELFSVLLEANAVDPWGENTKMLKIRFIEMLGDLGLIPQGSSVESVCSLIEPSWSRSGIQHKWSHLTYPQLDDEDTATLLFCSMAGAGWGFVIPPVLLPRPRLLMQWRGFYPDSSAVSVAEMATGRGVIARGTQVGTSFGFIGVGFAFAFPGAPAQFGFLGYSLMTVLQGADMTWYYANFPPLVMEVTPEDGAVEVPVSLSELRFTLKDYDFDKMTYSVVTSPDIGSGSDANVGNGEVSIPVGGLDGGTTYTWTVTVSDGTETVENTFTFMTEAVAPVISNPLPKNNALFVPIETSQLSFDLMDYQGDLMDWTVETKPNIGSGNGSNVNNGRYSIIINNLDFYTNYTWFINATDGSHWTRRAYTFRTTAENVSIFEPIDDSYVSSTNPNQNTGNHVSLSIRTGDINNQWWAAPTIKFNLSSLPINSSILSATLNIYYYDYADGNPAGRHLVMYRFLSDWVEETINWNNMPSINPMQTTISYVPSAPETWITWNVTDDVQRFFNGSIENYGWIIKDETSGGLPITYVRSKEYGSVTPYLLVEIDISK